MRTEIKLIQRKLGCTMIFVTHDQEEALTIGDKIAIMKDGVVQQVDTPKGVYHRPANLFVGSFIGLPAINRIDCRLQARDGGLLLVADSFSLPVPAELAPALEKAPSARVTLGVRPELVGMGAEGPLAGVVKLVELMGSRTLVIVDHQGTDMRVLVQGEPGAREGDPVRLDPNLARAFYFDETGRNLLV